MTSLSPDQIETFRRDGVLHIPGLFDAAWVERLRGACERMIAAPSEVGADLTPEGKSGRFFGDYFVWRQDPVALLGQASGVVIYSRNIRLIYKRRRREARAAESMLGGSAT